MNISSQPVLPARSMSLQSLLAGIATVATHHERNITGLSLDSRQIKDNDLFIAVPGEAHDGRDYIDSAIRNGASAVAQEATDETHSAPLAASGAPSVRKDDADNIPNFNIIGLKEHVGTIASRFFANPSARMQLLGITGTNGKTTCAFLLAQALTHLGQRCALMSTIGRGFVGELQPSPLTTLDAISNHRILAELLDKQATTVCMEVSSHALQQKRTQHIAFDIAVLTNLSHDHLDYHCNMENYRRAKQKLFHSDGLKCAVINSDDAFGRQLLQTHGAMRCLSYGMHNSELRPDVCARHLELSENGMAFEVEYRGQIARVDCRLVGAVNVPNVLATIATLLACGYQLQQIVAGVHDCQPPPGRMEWLPKYPSQPNVVIDYAHTPDALQHALSSAAELCDGTLSVVFGCGGDRDRSKRQQMGKIAESLADRVIVTDDNPRTEKPQHIVAQIISGMHTKPLVIHARRLAIETAISTACAKDVVLIAGKGHETSQTIGTQCFDFSDRDIATTTLEHLAANKPLGGGDKT